jgi:hypothetical protein
MFGPRRTKVAIRSGGGTRPSPGRLPAPSAAAAYESCQTVLLSEAAAFPAFLEPRRLLL